MKLSAVIIARNEEDMIADAIDSLSFADEVVVIDNASTDRTKDVAKMMSAKVFSANSADFSRLRNEGREKAKGEWILYIDADERVSPALQNSIKNKVLSSKYDGVSAFRVQRKNFYFGNHEWPYIEHLERLFKKEKLKGWKGALHESPEIEGEVGVLEGFLLHYTHRDLAGMVKKTIEWSKTEAMLRYKAGHPKMTWWRFPRVMTTAFFNSYVRQKGYKAGTVGLIESMYQSFSMFITYARLWEMQKEVES
ncbi:MAG TPA: glycosyltransferase family 2 protein [Candidatus Saccharimonadales bacterium]|nr:glycosyltransferase family 2 protein [Candidatus Saccharimonadales bacterium]